ncbi:speedy protein 1-B-like [Xenopus laevis]|uniref:Speedy protein 1-B-like n=1 Tax=Xenopus laevis TaxID=8355 RepID=A0A8J1L6W5_XENLA|nr:speedy protein 1-B-like [Xenopus laevis]
MSGGYRKRTYSEAMSPDNERPWKRMRSEEKSRSPAHSDRPEPAAGMDFYQLLEKEAVKRSLDVDSCMKTSDKYLLAMAKIYMQRAGLHKEEYTEMNFITALLLANDMEEDLQFPQLIYKLVNGKDWQKKWKELRARRLELWARMNFQGWVNRTSCEEAMVDNPTHWAWKRERHEGHGLSIKSHARKREFYYFKGFPKHFPQECSVCRVKATEEAQPAKVPFKIRMKNTWKKKDPPANDIV